MEQASSPSLNLADIHLPTEPSWFPLAWGWWVVICIALLLILCASWFLWRRQRQHQAKREAISALAASQSLNAINLLLKRAALSYFPRQQVAALTGTAWLAFLDSQLPEKKRGFSANAAAWQAQLFSPNPEISAEQLAQYRELAKSWLRALPPKQSRSPHV